MHINKASCLCLFIHVHKYSKYLEIQECPSVEGKPPACFDLVDCCDLALDPLTFISEPDLDIVVTYLHAKNYVNRSSDSKVIIWKRK